MTDNLVIIARARRLKALGALDGPRRARPIKTRLFGLGLERQTELAA